MMNLQFFCNVLGIAFLEILKFHGGVRILWHIFCV